MKRIKTSGLRAQNKQLAKKEKKKEKSKVKR